MAKTTAITDRRDSRLAVALRERRIFAEALAEANARFGEKVKELSILRRISDSISSNLDERVVCEALVNIITSEMTCENCSVMLLSADRKALQLRCAQGQADKGPRYFAADDPKMARIPLGEGIAGWVAKTGEPMLVQNTATERHFKKLKKSIKGISSMLCMPLTVDNAVIGVMNMSHPNIGQFSKENERFITLIAGQAAMAFKNIRLFGEIRKFNEEMEAAVTERTKELRNSESKYRTLMQQGSDGIVIADRNGTILECNDTAARLSGVGPRAWVGKPVSALLPAAGAAILRGAPKQVSRKAAIQETVLRNNRRKKGVPVRVSAVTVKLAEGPVLHLTIHDISQRVLLDEKLQQYSTQLEQEVLRRTAELQDTRAELIQTAKLAALGELASGVAHEINNPLAIITGYAEDLKDRILQGEAPGKTTLIGALDMIAESAQRAHAITQEILDFSSPRPIKIARHTTGDILEAAVAMAGPRMKRRGITLRIGGSARDTALQTDKSHLVQVLINLLNNAADASAEEGVIDLGAEMRGKDLAVSVTDHGHGIAAEHLEKIFDPFFTTKDPGMGSGLGLSISFRIIQKLGGRLTVESRPGLTTFTVLMPTTHGGNGKGRQERIGDHGR